MQGLGTSSIIHLEDTLPTGRALCLILAQRQTRRGNAGPTAEGSTEDFNQHLSKLVNRVIAFVSHYLSVAITSNQLFLLHITLLMQAMVIRFFFFDRKKKHFKRCINYVFYFLYSDALTS